MRDKEAHKAYMREYMRAYYLKHPGKRHHRKNPEKASLSRKRARSRNLDHYRDYNRRWAKTNIGAQRASKAKALIIRMGGVRVPQWSEVDLIVDFYERAVDVTRVSGTMHDVDHIVPLRGKYVCGLHVFANLQLLTARDNRVKNCSFPEK